MKMLQITDIHLTAPGDLIDGRDPEANLERALTHALRHHGDAEALIITGDLSDRGDPADYHRLRARLGAVSIPWRLCIGNHDDRAAFLEAFPDHADPDGHTQTALPLSEGVAVMLDTVAPGTDAGGFCEARAAWADRALAEADGPAHIFLHHNPMPTHLSAMDEIMLFDEGRFGALVRRWRDKIAHIHFGHCHMPISGSFEGAPISSIRGTNHAGWASFDREGRFCLSELPESYAVVFGAGLTVTKHMIEFGYEGPLRAE